MSEAFPDEAVLWFDSAGRNVDANDGALRLLGMTREEWLTSAVDRFVLAPSEEGTWAALRSEWPGDEAPTLVGAAAIELADGSTISVSYAIDKVAGGFRARLSPIDGPSPDMAPVLTVGDVLREWRAAERGLAELSPGSPAWIEIEREIETLRMRYQEVFRSVSGSALPESPA